MLRSWHLAVLRFAVTRENADKLGMLAAANEIDGLGRRYDDGSEFGFFRKTSSELCAAILKRDEASDKILRRYLAQIDDVRLNRALAAALEIENAERAAERRRSKLGPSLWHGLPSRGDLSGLRRLR